MPSKIFHALKGSDRVEGSENLEAAGGVSRKLYAVLRLILIYINRVDTEHGNCSSMFLFNIIRLNYYATPPAKPNNPADRVSFYSSRFVPFGRPRFVLLIAFHSVSPTAFRSIDRVHSVSPTAFRSIDRVSFRFAKQIRTVR